MLGGFGFPELLVIFLVVLLFFGARRLPDLAGGIGKSIRAFRKGLKDDQDEAMKEMHQSSNGTPKDDEKSVRPS